MVVSSVISQSTSVIIELNTIAKICKYKKFHEEHHFIPIAVKVHSALGHDVNHFVRECIRLFHNRRSKGHLSLSFLHSNFQGNVLALLFSMF